MFSFSEPQLFRYTAIDFVTWSEGARRELWRRSADINVYTREAMAAAAVRIPPTLVSGVHTGHDFSSRTFPTSQDSTDTRPAEEGPLIPASSITTDFDALRFEAAASLQFQGQRQDQQVRGVQGSYQLISSPYNDPDHLLDLQTLDTPCRLLSLALTFLKPTRLDYATADYLASFNWSEVLVSLRTLAAAEGYVWREQSFYTVIFRSEVNIGIDLDWLHALDKTSHREATVSGQLLKYWFGKKDDKERNLATCKSFLFYDEK